MDTSSFKAYLADRYDDQIQWYDKKATENQNRYKSAQLAVIVLSALTPVLIEINIHLGSDYNFGYLAMFTSVTVAILTTLLKTFKYQENWLTYRNTCETLRKEKHFFDFDLGDYGNTENKQALFVERVESLISRENTMWISSQKTELKSKNQKSATAIPTETTNAPPGPGKNMHGKNVQNESA